jgi:hypothetical protein
LRCWRSTRERIGALDLRLDDVTAEQVLPASAEPSALELTTLSEVEEALSQTCQHLLVSSGRATPPEPKAATGA